MTPNHVRRVGDLCLGLWPSRVTRRRSWCSARSRAKRGGERNAVRKLGKHPATFERQVAARSRRARPQGLHQMVVQASRAEQRALDQHLAALLRERTARRDEHDLTVRMSGLAGRCLGDFDALPGDEGGEEAETGRAVRIGLVTSGQDRIDEFAERAHDIRDRRRAPGRWPTGRHCAG